MRIYSREYTFITDIPTKYATMYVSKNNILYSFNFKHQCLFTLSLICYIFSRDLIDKKNSRLDFVEYN